MFNQDINIPSFPDTPETKPPKTPIDVFDKGKKITRDDIIELSINNSLVHAVLCIQVVNKDISWEDALHYIIIKLVEQNNLLTNKLVSAEMTRNLLVVDSSKIS